MVPSLGVNVSISNLFFCLFSVLDSNNRRQSTDFKKAKAIFPISESFLMNLNWEVLERCRHVWLFPSPTHCLTRVNPCREIVTKILLSLSLTFVWQMKLFYSNFSFAVARWVFSLKYFSKVRTNSYVLCMKAFTESFALFINRLAITYVCACPCPC